ncbi:hypothetical protein [Actinoplanes sp. NPDC051851]|uniref:hypothetical protein n=1 Tax=Actinoplanes sp. NPDC051851 TaxID=3154753 RepID=UPI003428011E
MTRDHDGPLAEGFAILLGRPLEDFEQDATYAVVHSGDDAADELFRRSFDVGVLARGEIVHPPYPSFPVLGDLLVGWAPDPPLWSIDLGRSFVRAGDPGDGAEIGLPELDTGMTGAEIGRVLAERGWRPKRLRRAYPEIEFRVHTDGTLVGAMRAATGTMGTIGHTGPVPGVEPEWERALAALPAELRDHLSVFCRDENSVRSSGAFYLGAEDPGLLRPAPVVAAWHYGESQAWTAVVRLEAGEWPGAGE